MNRLTATSLLLAFLIAGCVRPEVHWPPKDGSHELVLVGPFVEAQNEKNSEYFLMFEEVLLLQILSLVYMIDARIVEMKNISIS